MRFLHCDLMTGGMALASALGSHAMGRTQKFEAQKAADEARGNAESRFRDYMKKLNERYSSELGGKLTDTDLAARTQAVDETGKNVAQQANRLGIQGGVGQNAIPAQALQKYVSEIDKDLLATASARQTRAKDMISNAEMTGQAALEPFETAAEGAKTALNKDQLGAMDLAPTLLSYGLGTIGNMAGGNYDPLAMARGASANQLLQPFGLDASILKQAGGQSVVNGRVQEASYDAFGNTVNKDLGPAQKTEGTSYYDPATKQYVTQPKTPDAVNPVTYRDPVTGKPVAEGTSADRLLQQSASDVGTKPLLDANGNVVATVPANAQFLPREAATPQTANYYDDAAKALTPDKTGYIPSIGVNAKDMKPGEMTKAQIMYAQYLQGKGDRPVIEKPWGVTANDTIANWKGVTVTMPDGSSGILTDPAQIQAAIAKGAKI